MAQKKVINKVKNGSGYDTLFPQILSQVHYAKTVSGSSTAYTITIDMPAEEITAPIIVCFTPNVTNGANATININGLGAKALYLNNGAISASQITTSDKCLVYYDKTASSATLLSVSSFVKIPKATSAQASALSDNNSYITPLTLGSGVLAASRYQPKSPISKSNVKFNDTYAVTGGRIIHYDIWSSGYTSSRYTKVRINGTNIGGTSSTYQYLQWNAQNSTYATTYKISIDIDTFTHTLKVIASNSSDEATTHIYYYDSLTSLVISNVGNAHSSVGYKIFGYSISA